MRRRVIASRRISFFRIDDRRDLVADLDRTGLDLRFVKYQSRQWCECVEYFEASERIFRRLVSTRCIRGSRLTSAPGTNKNADIPNLPSSLRIERRVVQDNKTFLAFL